jgi:acetyl-CoA C-acetyltransferase
MMASIFFISYTETGGNSPQQAVNVVCERIAKGQADLALVTGAEFLGSLMKRLKGGLGFDGWGDDIAEPPQRIGDPRPGVTLKRRLMDWAIP